jgi:hypothetical protein
MQWKNDHTPHLYENGQQTLDSNTRDGLSSLKSFLAKYFEVPWQIFEKFEKGANPQDLRLKQLFYLGREISK